MKFSPLRNKTPFSPAIFSTGLGERHATDTAALILHVVLPWLEVPRGEGTKRKGEDLDGLRQPSQHLSTNKEEIKSVAVVATCGTSNIFNWTVPVALQKSKHGLNTFMACQQGLTPWDPVGGTKNWKTEEHRDLPVNKYAVASPWR